MHQGALKGPKGTPGKRCFVCALEKQQWGGGASYKQAPGFTSHYTTLASDWPECPVWKPHARVLSGAKFWGVTYIQCCLWNQDKATVIRTAWESTLVWLSSLRSPVSPIPFRFSWEHFLHKQIPRLGSLPKGPPCKGQAPLLRWGCTLQFSLWTILRTQVEETLWDLESSIQLEESSPFWTQQLCFPVCLITFTATDPPSTVAWPLWAAGQVMAAVFLNSV